MFTVENLSQCWGDVAAAQEKLQRGRGSMRDILNLEDLPDIQPDTGELDHMRLQEFVPWHQVRHLIYTHAQFMIYPVYIYIYL